MTTSLGWFGFCHLETFQPTSMLPPTCCGLTPSSWNNQIPGAHNCKQGTQRPSARSRTNAYTEEEEKSLLEIIEAFNGRHGTTFSREDFLRFERVNQEIMDEDMKDKMRNNPAMMAMARGSRDKRIPSQAKPSSFSEFWKKTQSAINTKK